jgi:hypothetical protein
MNEKNTLALVAAAPLLYRHYEDGKYPWPIQYGFECGDGWVDLLMSLSLKIEVELQAALAAGKRRQDLQCADQVKEKFGKLRFYLRSGRKVPSTWRVWIDEAAMASGKTCERCGTAGRMHRRAGFLQTLCPACARAGKFEPFDLEGPD